MSITFKCDRCGSDMLTSKVSKECSLPVDKDIWGVHNARVMIDVIPSYVNKDAGNIYPQICSDCVIEIIRGVK